jgi:hypothetical protein
MRKSIVVWLVTVLIGLLPSVRAEDDPCVTCHQGLTPGIVGDWQAGKHQPAGIGCVDCHGDGHTSAADVADVTTITAHTCKQCHETQYGQYAKGKHAGAWGSVQVLPMTHALPMALGPGMKTCDGCHKIGLKGSAEIEALKKAGSMFGHASCDACHTRHTFSVTEARQPQACQTCHMGSDHAQWEMWSSSKHGVRFLLKQNGTLPASTAAPTCQTCHMREGNHEVRTPWGFLGVRLPLPEDEQWRADQTTVLQALGILDSNGDPTDRLGLVFEVGDMARLTQEAFDSERNALLAVCSECHSENFARAEFAKGDAMIREADHLLAEAIENVAALYRDGILRKPEGQTHDYPDLLSFNNAPEPIELRLFDMHLKHRMRAFQGAFHANPEYALSHGWSEMVRDLTEIRRMAKELRADRKE